MLVGVACGNESGKSPGSSSGGSAGSGGKASSGGAFDAAGSGGADEGGAAGSGTGGGLTRDRFGARLTSGSEIMTSSNYRVVGAMTTGIADNANSKSKNYRLHGGKLSGTR